VVVDDDGELVGEDAVGSEEDEVADGLREFFVHAKAPGSRSFSRRQAVGASSGVAEVAIECADIGVRDFFARAAARVDETFLLELFERGSVGFGALALIHYGAVPFEAEEFEIAEDAAGGSRLFAGFIDVFHANEPFALVLASIEVAGDGGDKGSEVEGPGG
jgi:hypothetical protein